MNKIFTNNSQKNLFHIAHYRYIVNSHIILYRYILAIHFIMMLIYFINLIRRMTYVGRYIVYAMAYAGFFNVGGLKIYKYSVTPHTDPATPLSQQSFVYQLSAILPLKIVKYIKVI